MATMRLIPSVLYNAAGTSYLTVSNESNAFANTDSTDYATVRNTQSSTSSRYVYLRGFNFDGISDDWIINSFAVKIKAYESGVSTSSSYVPYLCNGTSTLSGCTTTAISTSASVHTFTCDLDWETVKAYGSNFGIRINCRRASRNTTGYMYIYGAEIEVDYTIPVYHDVTLSNSTSATVTVSDSHPLEGTDVTVVADTLSGINVTDNGVNVNSQFVQGLSDSVSAVPESDYTTGFSDSGAAFYQSSSTSSDSWLRYAIGHSAESPYSTSNTSNTYVKPEGDTGWINYHFDFSAIPAGATIKSVGVKVYGARENATVDSTHVARFQCYSGSTAKGTIQDFTSTSNSLVTVSDVGTWTPAELQDAQLRFEVGYYGGRMLGITWTVEYEVDGYVYTITNITADHAIVISATGEQPALYVKPNGSWLEVVTAYEKVNGVWAEAADVTAVFSSGVNYINGGSA